MHGQPRRLTAIIFSQGTLCWASFNITAGDYILRNPSRNPAVDKLQTINELFFKP
jgi:hypothetical protein